MTHAKYGFRTLLDRYLKRHGDPPSEDVGSAVERVWRRLEPEVLRATASPSFRFAPTRTWHFAVAAVAAAAVIAVLSSGLIRQRISTSSARAVVEHVDGSLYGIVNGEAVEIRVGDTLRSGETVRTKGGAGAMLALADGSRIEMRSQSELSVERMDDGIGIRLRTGGIIVNAVKQRSGRLYVQTKDMTVSVVGTVFLVNAGEDGSRVAVIEGEVRVQHKAAETKLRPGEQVSTSPTLAARPVKEEIAWSRHADAHLAILAAFAKGMAATVGPLKPLATTSGSVPATPDQAGTAAGRREFEEASIRQCDPDNLPSAPAGGRGGGPNSLQMTPGRTHALCLTLATLIRTAYGYGPMALELMNSREDGPRRERGMRFENVYGLGVEDGERVRGGPDWVRSDRYTIEAVGDPAADAETMRGPMLQALLERRFQLKAHIEAEQMPGYALVVAPGGLKMRPFQDGDCSRDVSDAVKAERARKGWTGPVLITEAAHFGITPNCGVYGETNGPNYHFEVVGSVPGMVAGFAGMSLGVRVVNRTNITGRYIYTWDFGIDDQTPGALQDLQRGKTWNPKPGWDSPMTIPKAPSIFAAVDQLGLKLEPIRVPREFIVIDRVERPSPN